MLLLWKCSCPRRAKSGDLAEGCAGAVNSTMEKAVASGAFMRLFTRDEGTLADVQP